MIEYFNLSSRKFLSDAEKYFYAAHVDFIEAYGKRTKEILIEMHRTEIGNEKRAPSHEDIIDITSEEYEFREFVSKIRNNCWFPPFRDLRIPAIFVENAHYYYDWAPLFRGIRTPENKIASCDCVSELKKVIPINENIPLEDPTEWHRCPYMLRAANEQLDSLERKIYLKGASQVTLWVWHALDFLLKHFSAGGDFIDEQTAFEICMYRAVLASYNLRFADKTFSGLEEDSHLAGFVEFAIYLGFSIRMNESRVILEHDIRVAMADSPAGSRLLVKHSPKLALM